MVTSARTGRPHRPWSRRARVLSAALLLPVVLLGACTAEPADDEASGSASTAVTAPDDTPTTGGSAGDADTTGASPSDGTGSDEPSSVPSAGAPLPDAPAPTSPSDGEDLQTVAPDVRSTAARRSEPPEDVVSLVDVQVDETGDSETVRFVTSGGVPGYTARYVDVVRIEGEPVLVAGAAFLEVVLESASPDGEEGLSPDVAVELLVEQDVVQEVRFARYVDGAVTYAVGLSEQADFTVAQDETGLTLTFAR